MNANQYIALVFFVLALTLMFFIIIVRIIIDKDEEKSFCKIKYKSIIIGLLIVITSILFLDLTGQYNIFSFIIGYLIGCILMLICPISNNEIILKKEDVEDE